MTESDGLTRLDEFTNDGGHFYCVVTSIRMELARFHRCDGEAALDFMYMVAAMGRAADVYVWRKKRWVYVTNDMVNRKNSERWMREHCDV